MDGKSGTFKGMDQRCKDGEKNDLPTWNFLFYGNKCQIHIVDVVGLTKMDLYAPHSRERLQHTFFLLKARKCRKMHKFLMNDYYSAFILSLPLFVEERKTRNRSSRTKKHRKLYKNKSILCSTQHYKNVYFKENSVCVCVCVRYI